VRASAAMGAWAHILQIATAQRFGRAIADRLIVPVDTVVSDTTLPVVVRRRSLDVSGHDSRLHSCATVPDRPCGTPARADTAHDQALQSTRARFSPVALSGAEGQGVDDGRGRFVGASPQAPHVRAAATKASPSVNTKSTR
jgi:hypothetical protein